MAVVVKELNQKLINLAEKEHSYFKNWHWVFQYLYYLLTFVLFFILSGPWTYQKRLVQECNNHISNLKKISSKDKETLTKDDNKKLTDIIKYVEKFSKALNYTLISDLEIVKKIVGEVDKKLDKISTKEGDDTKPVNNLKIPLSADSTLPLTKKKVEKPLDSAFSSATIKNGTSTKVNDKDEEVEAGTQVSDISVPDIKTPEQLLQDVQFESPTAWLLEEPVQEMNMVNFLDWAYSSDTKLPDVLKEILPKLFNVFKNLDNDEAAILSDTRKGYLTTLFTLSDKIQSNVIGAFIKRLFVPAQERIQLYSSNPFVIEAFQSFDNPGYSIVLLTLALNASEGLKEYDDWCEDNEDKSLVTFLKSKDYRFGSSPSLDKLVMAVVICDNKTNGSTKDKIEATLTNGLSAYDYLFNNNKSLKKPSTLTSNSTKRKFNAFHERLSTYRSKHSQSYITVIKEEILRRLELMVDAKQISSLNDRSIFNGGRIEEIEATRLDITAGGGSNK